MEGGVRSGDARLLHIVMNCHTHITSSISVSPRDRRILQAGHRLCQITLVPRCHSRIPSSRLSSLRQRVFTLSCNSPSHISFLVINCPSICVAPIRHFLTGGGAARASQRFGWRPPRPAHYSTTQNQTRRTRPKTPETNRPLSFSFFLFILVYKWQRNRPRHAGII